MKLVHVGMFSDHREPFTSLDLRQSNGMLINAKRVEGRHELARKIQEVIEDHFNTSAEE